MRYIVEFEASSELAENASDVVYKALVSVLGNIGHARVVRDGATFIGYLKEKDQPIIWMEVSRES
jgi:hypothetical protein